MILLFALLISLSRGTDPECYYTCSATNCTSTCTPICMEPICVYECFAPTPDASCNSPFCSTNCPDGQDPMSSCPSCEIDCSPLQCTPTNANCTILCQAPQCDWSCVAPTNCPVPVCTLACDSPACAHSGARKLAASLFGLILVLLML